MPQIDGDALVERLGCHVGCRVTLVIRGVVDENVGGADRNGKLRDRRPQSVDVANIRFCEATLDVLPSSSATSAFDGASAMSIKPTLAFCRTNPRTMAAPIPEPPPVTSTDFPSRS